MAKGEKKLHLHPEVHYNRHQKKSKEPKSFPDPSHRSVWKLPVARCQIAHKAFLQHSNAESKSETQAAWKEQFSCITTQPCAAFLKNPIQLLFPPQWGQ